MNGKGNGRGAVTGIDQDQAKAYVSAQSKEAKQIAVHRLEYRIDPTRTRRLTTLCAICDEAGRQLVDCALTLAAAARRR